jgi:hypothetical protein
MTLVTNARSPNPENSAQRATEMSLSNQIHFLIPKKSSDGFLLINQLLQPEIYKLYKTFLEKAQRLKSKATQCQAL